MRIFLIEDTSSAAEFLINVLEHDGHEVDWVSTVSEGADKLRKNDYDFAILDYNVIGGHGTDLLPYLEGNTETVVYTALPSRADGYGVPVFDKMHPNALLEYVDAAATRFDVLE